MAATGQVGVEAIGWKPLGKAVTWSPWLIQTSGWSGSDRNNGCPVSVRVTDA